MTATRGALYLVPNALDLGADGSAPAIADVLPATAIDAAARLEHWVVENARSARAFLKRIGAVRPIAAPLRALSIVELPRPRKGGAPGHARAAGGGEETEALPSELAARLLAPAVAGFDLGLLSEAGLPAVADPGARLVAAAHAAGVRVVALPGPSSLMLALAASGLNGQQFAFVGYLPVDAADRAGRIRQLEAESRRRRETQLVIETPYRNAALLAALVEHLQPATRLSVSCGLTLPGGSTRSMSVTRWRSGYAPLPADVPAVFAFLSG